MKSIDVQQVQEALQLWLSHDVYLHLETTNGAYAALHSDNAIPVGAYIRNGLVSIERATIKGHGPYRVGLKMQLGWIYAEGLTDYEIDDQGRLLLSGNDSEGRLMVALELSETPFPV